MINYSYNSITLEALKPDEPLKCVCNSVNSLGNLIWTNKVKPLFNQNNSDFIKEMSIVSLIVSCTLLFAAEWKIFSLYL